MAYQPGSEQHTPAEQLRRRLYDGSATDEDRARYRALVEAAEPPSPPPTPRPPDPEARSERRGSQLPIAGIAALAVIAGIAIGVLTRAPDLPTAAPPTPIAVDGETRSDFVQNLAAGGAAGIAAYLVTHRSPAGLRGATRFYTIERNGVGPRTVALDPAPREADRGRATVFLVVEWPENAGWAAYDERSRHGDGPPRPEARRAGHQEGGVPTAATFAYRAGRRPVQLYIDVPDGVRWGAAVVFSD